MENGMPDAITHPTPQQLAAFSQGKLPEAAAVAVAEHLRGCPACRQAVAKLAPGSMVPQVRSVRPATSSTRMATAPTLQPATEVYRAPAVSAGFPPELAHHSKYRLLRELGRGGMGVVYQAEQTLMERKVALKVINASVLEHPDALPRFHAEVKAAARLDHPNIVRAHDADQAGNLHFLVMEFVEGQTLAQLVEQKGPLPIAPACRAIRQAALGLQHAFEQGMTHRDIKPQNLMLTPKGVVKILDFGLARVRSQQLQTKGLTQADAFMGTPEYVAPEQATDARKADTRADIYSLGCTLYFLLTGRPPFREDTVVLLLMAHLEKQPRPLHDIRPNVPPELSAVMAKMLAKNPADRYQQPVEVAQALMPFGKPGLKAASDQTIGLPPHGASSAAKKPEVTQAESPFDRLVDEPRTDANEKWPASAPWWQRPVFMAGAGAALVMTLVLAGLWASGVMRGSKDNGGILPKSSPHAMAALRKEVQDSLDQWFIVGTRWEGKIVQTEPTPGEGNGWFIITGRDGNKYHGRFINEYRFDGTVEGVLNEDQRSFTWKIVDQALNVWRPELSPIESFEAGGKWQDGYPHLDFRWALPDGKVMKGTMEFTTKRVVAKGEEAGQWPRSRNPGAARCSNTGFWQVAGEVLIQQVVVQDGNTPAFLNFGDYSWQEYDLRLKAMKTAGENGFIISFDIPRSNKLTQWCIGLKGNRESYVESIEFLPTGMQSTRRAGPKPIRVVDHRWYDIHLKARGNRVECFLDGDSQFHFTDADRRGGRFGITCLRMAAMFKDLEITAPDGSVLWKGPPKLP
jgi:serine/threonine protein kinase